MLLVKIITLHVDINICCIIHLACKTQKYASMLTYICCMLTELNILHIVDSLYPLAPSLAAFCWCIRYILCMSELNKSLSASMSLVKYFYLVIHVYEHVSLQIAWIYILYMFVICASTCIELFVWTLLDWDRVVCVLCVIATCVLVIYHVCCMSCLVGPWFGNKLYCIVLYSML